MDSLKKSIVKETHINLPLTDDVVGKLSIGDIVYLNGLIFTGREGVYSKLFDKGDEPDIDIRSLSNVTFHCSPAVSEISPGKYNVTSVTATASFRFAKYMPELIHRFGIKGIIGKAGMPPDIYKNIFKPNGTIYLNTVGYGLGAIYGSGIKRVQNVLWKEELGLAQAMWFFEVERFGPFIVESDTKGRSLFEEENNYINRKLMSLYNGLPEPIMKRLGERTSPDMEMV